MTLTKLIVIPLPLIDAKLPLEIARRAIYANHMALYRVSAVCAGAGRCIRYA